MTRSSNWAHEGYMDGLQGKEPDAQLAGLNEYDDAWLIGTQDRDKGVKPTAYPFLEKRPELRGRMVIVPKGVMVKVIGKDPKPAGKTYKVKVDHMLSPCAAYWDTSCGWNRKELVRPRPAAVCWAGAGGYWAEASLDDVVLEEGVHA